MNTLLFDRYNGTKHENPFDLDGFENRKIGYWKTFPTSNAIKLDSLKRKFYFMQKVYHGPQPISSTGSLLEIKMNCRPG